MLDLQCLNSYSCPFQIEPTLSQLLNIIKTPDDDKKRPLDFQKPPPKQRRTNFRPLRRILPRPPPPPCPTSFVPSANIMVTTTPLTTPQSSSTAAHPPACILPIDVHPQTTAQNSGVAVMSSSSTANPSAPFSCFAGPHTTAQNSGVAVPSHPTPPSPPLFHHPHLCPFSAACISETFSPPAATPNFLPPPRPSPIATLPSIDDK